MSTDARAPDDETDLTAEPTADELARPLTPLEAAFAEQYIIDFDAGAAALRAGSTCKPSSAKQIGYAMLQRPVVRAAVQAAIAARSKRTGITADAVLRRWWDKANADPRELVEIRRTCCRYCHGKDFDYQRTKSEFARDRKKAGTSEFDEQGGEGYNARKDPHPDCPECFGGGVEQIVVHDTRTLSPAALSIFAGVKSTKNGVVEVRTHSQDDALTNAARHLGMFTEKFEHSGPGGGPIPIDVADARTRIRDRIAGIASRMVPPAAAAPSATPTATATSAPAAGNGKPSWAPNGNGNGRHA